MTSEKQNRSWGNRLKNWKEDSGLWKIFWKQKDFLKKQKLMWKRMFKTWKIYHLINKAVEFKKKSRKKPEVNKGHPNRNIQWMNLFY